MAEAPVAGPGTGKGERGGRLRRDAATTTAGQVVSCRLSPEEIGVFDALCTQMGAASRSDGLRSIIRMSGGFLEFSRADSDALEGLHRELHRIGVNVNQVAHAANRGRGCACCSCRSSTNGGGAPMQHASPQAGG